ncbi:MAG: hypothetical protein WB798_12820, partial [Nocardioidaceae bacterium]
WVAPRPDAEEHDGRTGDAGGAAGRSGLEAQTAMGRAPSESAVADSEAETVGEDAGGEDAGREDGGTGDNEGGKA